MQTSWGNEAPPFRRLIDQRDELMSDELRQQLIDDLWKRAEIDSHALNEASWALVEQWDTALHELNGFAVIGSPAFQWQLNRLKEIDQTIESMEVPTPLSKKERKKAFKKIAKRMKGAAA
ncbi:hypothetical protein WIX39_022655 [Variovorax sp. AB1(2024)]|uniref:hypothetical protein n=1 Tax=Variovorax sp. AB1(2024) TaxID=3132214 RepID=UPI0030B46819